MSSKKNAPRPRWSLRLERARVDAGFRAAIDFARHMGLSQQRYAHYEGGLREPDFQLLVEMCSALKVTPNYILTGAEARADSEAA